MAFEEVASDLLSLTKLTWDASGFGTELPLTSTVSRAARCVFSLLGPEQTVLEDWQYF